MSEVKLNLVDAEQVRHGTIHASMADRCIAALSAEPETINELEAALTRYIKPRDSNEYFSWFTACPIKFSFSSETSDSQLRSVLDTEPWDAGIVVIDLAGRIVAIESTYSQPGPQGEVSYHDGQAATGVQILYRLPDDWVFVNSVEAYEWSRARRVNQRAENRPFDARPILFGRPLLQFLVNACLSLPVENLSAVAASLRDEDAIDEVTAAHLSTIHARWLLTPRDDLRGQAPRDVMLARQDFIDFDLHTRSLQWSELNEGPPCLAENSFAYQFAGFGTHEWVLYYDLVRYLLNILIEKVAQTSFNADSAEELIRLLEQLKTEWLNTPQPELDGRIPAILINNERKRLPEALRPREMIIDEDCPMCMMFGDETSPLSMGVGFWHLDGCNMDEDFAFSSFKTREEWEADNRRQEDMQLEFARKDYERRQLNHAETLEFARFVDPEWDSEPN